jgi:hypothetical protein
MHAQAHLAPQPLQLRLMRLVQRGLAQEHLPALALKLANISLQRDQRVLLRGLASLEDISVVFLRAHRRFPFRRVRPWAPLGHATALVATTTPMRGTGAAAAPRPPFCARLLLRGSARHLSRPGRPRPPSLFELAIVFNTDPATRSRHAYASRGDV